MKMIALSRRFLENSVNKLKFIMMFVLLFVFAALYFRKIEAYF